jgi:hypothetical protein
MYIFLLSRLTKSWLNRRYKPVAIPVNFLDNFLFLLSDFQELIQVQKYIDWFGSIVRVGLFGFIHQIHKFAYNPVAMFADLLMFLHHMDSCNVY